MLTYDLSKKGNKSLYEYLYQEMREDILGGRLKAGEKLPSKRELAGHLQVSVKTVENAYSQLLLEGYIYAEEKRGYFVSRIEAEQGRKPGFAPCVKREKEEEYLADLTGNQVHYEKFPFSVWAKAVREVLTEYDTRLLETIPFQGAEELRREIAEYLYRYRGMEVPPEHIVIGAGTEFLYSRLLQLFGKDAIYAVENPGYKKIVKFYEGLKLPWECVDIDEQGLDVEELAKTKANVVHVSPGHHYPMGMVMPVGRRQELLRWAAEEPERYIIEDDYDCEFRFCGCPVPALQSMDRYHRVIYMNNFSRILLPSIRISYMVLPEKLMERYEAGMSFYSCTASGLEQYALARFLQQGCLERHIRRLVQYYRRQREALGQIFRESELSRIGIMMEEDAGTHFLLKIYTQLNDVEMKWAAAQQGIKVNCLSEYCLEYREKYSGILVINYSDLREDQWREVLRRLEEIFAEDIASSYLE